MTNPIAFALVDTETTGLDVAEDHLLEFALILTDIELNEIASFETLVRPQPTTFERILAVPAVAEMHARNGLIDALRASDPRDLPTVNELEYRVLALLDAHGVGPRLAIAGGGVAQFDQQLIRTQMPRLDRRLHYRPADSSIVAQMYLDATGYNDLFDVKPDKSQAAHRAMADLREDFAVLRAEFEMFRQIARLRHPEPVAA